MNFLAYVWTVDHCESAELARVLVTMDRLDGLTLIDDLNSELRIWIPVANTWLFSTLYPSLPRVPNLDIIFSPPL
jgi:hypothetical protein